MSVAQNLLSDQLTLHIPRLFKLTIWLQIWSTTQPQPNIVEVTLKMVVCFFANNSEIIMPATLKLDQNLERQAP